MANQANRIAQAISKVGSKPSAAAYACSPAVTEATNVQNFPPKLPRVSYQRH